MDEPHRPTELSEDIWQSTPLEVRQCIALLVTKLAALEARLNQTSQNSSKPPSSDPLSSPPTRTPRGKPKTKGVQPGHPDHQRDILPVTDVTQVVPIRPTCCPACQCALPDDLTPVEPPRRQQVWEVPLVSPGGETTSTTRSCVRTARHGCVPSVPPMSPPGRLAPRWWR